jgi:hypothetical protein
MSRKIYNKIFDSQNAAVMIKFSTFNNNIFHTPGTM